MITICTGELPSAVGVAAPCRTRSRLAVGTVVLRAALPVVTAALVLAGCSGTTTKTSSPQVTAPVVPLVATSSAATQSNSAPPAVAGTALTIASFAYDPTPLTVAPVAVVTVTNNDQAAHTVSSDKAGLFLADKVTKGVPVTFTAPAQPGTYTFFCAYHPKMHGTLIVK